VQACWLCLPTKVPLAFLVIDEVENTHRAYTEAYEEGEQDERAKPAEAIAIVKEFVHEQGDGGARVKRCTAAVAISCASSWRIKLRFAAVKRLQEGAYW
jgi:hypothetical protein